MTLNIQKLSKTISISLCSRKRSSADAMGINESVPCIGGTGNGLDNARGGTFGAGQGPDHPKKAGYGDR